MDVVGAERVGKRAWHCTASVFDFFLASRPRSSMFMKSVLPPVLSW